jgi:hypothetical protein
MDGLTVISEGSVPTGARWPTGWLGSPLAGYIGWVAVSMSWVAAQEARRTRACSVEEPGSAA